ncbi:MAG: ABC transporter ATP-binding protein [Candidatus Hydrogenedentes bacterium]|nr:ABC transporter ATP-binding protein [Candidatus Hydrogenedentota bacterium]
MQHHADPVSTTGDLDAIRIRGLTKEYAHGEGVHGLDLSIPRGCTFGLLGPNGAGKSTTIKLLMGLLKPTSGEAFVNGFSIQSESLQIRACVGYVPERHHIYPWMTVGEVIWFTRAFYETWDHTLCEDLLKQYELHPAKKVRELSHGMTTKLALVLALSHDPDILLLDEPTTGLDPLIREEFLDGIKSLIDKRPRTVLFSSHILSDIEKVADRIGIVNEGKLLLSATREELIRKTKRVEIELKPGGVAATPPPGTVLQESTAGRWQYTVYGFTDETIAFMESQDSVARCAAHDMSLEDIFKSVIKGARS